MEPAFCWDAGACEKYPAHGCSRGRGRNGRRHQLRVLSARYMKLVVNDRQRLLLLLVQAPLLAVLIPCGEWKAV